MRYKCVWEKKTTEKKWLYHVTFTSNKWLVNAMIYNIVFFRSPARKQSIRLWLDIPCWSHNPHYHNKLRKLVWAALFNSVSKCNSVLKVCIYSSFWKVTFLFSTVSRVWFKGLFHLKQGRGGCWELESILELLSFLKQAPSSTITERTCQNMQ